MALKGRRSTPEERLRAVQLLKEGNEAAVVARMFNVSRAMLFRWQQKYDQGGPVALETKKTPGPASRLSPTQLSKLYAIITGSDPRQLQFDFGLWTRKIIRELIAFSPENKKTNLAGALKYFTGAIKKRCTAFIISDFISADFEPELKIANKKHDVIALRLYDRHEQSFPDLGLIPVREAETGEMQWIHTGNIEVRNAYKSAAIERTGRLSSTFKKSGVDFTSIGTHENYVQPLMTLFKKRGSRK